MPYKQKPGRGPINKYGTLQQKGLIKPSVLQEKGKPATDAGGRVKMNDPTKFQQFEKFAGADAGGLRYNLLEARAKSKEQKIDRLKTGDSDEYSKKVQTKISKAEEKIGKFTEKQKKITKKREGNKGKRGFRNFLVGSTLIGASAALGAEFEEVPQERYTSFNIPAGLDPKQVPDYVNTMTRHRTSVNNPVNPATGQEITGWIDYNLDPNQPFDYNQQTGELSFTSTPSYAETGQSVYSKRKLTGWSGKTAIERIKKGVQFVKTNIM